MKSSDAGAPALDFPSLWNKALTYDGFVHASDLKHRGLWEGLHRLARIPDWALAAVPPDAGLRLLVLVEDWCGDASNTVPVLARLAEAAPGVELRVLRRDEYPAVMDRYLTNGSRSIPVVIALDEHFRERGHWGPRPTMLQAWVMAQRAAGAPKESIYPEVRRWYARDHGETTLDQVLAAAGFPAHPAGHEAPPLPPIGPA
ncbi:MAG TPA: thioredoxin family protein [Gemmatimonadales bacterium]|nr:thioredoxin family protein [Gemmatimonadales bacterium]